MTEFEIIYKSFMMFMEESQNYAMADDELITNYKGFFMDAKGDEDIIIDIWAEYGFCSYKHGLLFFLNPKEYNDIARSFPEVSAQAEVFARTATGCLFLWEKYDLGKAISFLNIHTGTKNIISTSFNVMMEWDLPRANFWTSDCNGKTEFAVMDKFKHIPHDKCAGYKLALALGGKDSVAHMELFDFKTHLELLAQLHN